jgi:hypothetical protein
MTLSIKTRVMLWGRAAARCSMSGCNLSLVMDATETDDPSLVGEICHIVAESENGPRGVSPLALTQRNSYGNLILMCNVHHKLIDDQPNTYTVEELHRIKSQHEAFVQSRLQNYSAQRQRSDEIVAGYIDEWVDRCGIEEWNAWTSFLLGGDPSISTERFDGLKNISTWLLSRIWPRDEFSELQKALDNFRRVAGNFVMVFDRHSDRRGGGADNDFYGFKKFYNIREYDEARYSKLLREYECEVALVEDYVLELTRAANLVCDAVRSELLPLFRLRQGALLVTRGMDMNFRVYTHRPEYKAHDFPELYRGEKDFNQTSHSGFSRRNRSGCSFHRKARD